MASKYEKNKIGKKAIQTNLKGYYREAICELLETVLVLLLSSM